MQFTLGHIGARVSASDDFNQLTSAYMARMAPYAQCEAAAFKTEDALFEWVSRQQGRLPITLVLLDSRGRTMSSEAFAAWIGERRDDGVRHTLFAVGPASGWSDSARKRAQLLLSFGPMTMAHSLARLVMAEQLYRACTILAGHPYHTGH